MLLDGLQGFTGAGRARGEKAGLPADARFGAAALPGATAGASAGKGTAPGAATWAAESQHTQQPQKLKGPFLMLHGCSHVAISKPDTLSAKHSLCHCMQAVLLIPSNQWS